MKKFYLLVAGLIVIMMLVGCSGTNPETQATPPINTSSYASLEPIDSYLETIISKNSTQELLSALNNQTKTMGDSGMFLRILNSEKLESQYGRVHKAIYTLWDGELEDNEKPAETIDLYYMSADMCDAEGVHLCDWTKAPVYVRIYYFPDGFTGMKHPLDSYEQISEYPAIFRRVTKDGERTIYYYQLSENYECLLRMDTDFVATNSQIIEQLQKYCLNLSE